VSLDDRFRRARGELDTAFDDGERPDFARVRARQRHRRAAAGGAGALALLAVVAVTVTRIGGDDDAHITAFGTTTGPIATSTSAPASTSTAPPTTAAAPSTSTAAPNTTTTAPTVAPTGHISVSGAEPTTAVAVRDDGTLVRLRTDTGEILETLAKEADPRSAQGEVAPNVITDAAMAPDGRVLYEDCCEPAVGNVFDVRTNGNQTQLEGTPSGSQSTYGTTPAVSPNGKYLALFENTKIDIYDLTTGKRIRTIDTKTAEGVVTHLTMSDNGAVAFELPNGAVPDPSVTSVTVLRADAQSMANTSVMLSSEFASTSNPTFMPDGRVVYVDRALSGKEEPSPDAPPRLRVAGPDGSGDTFLTAPLPFGVADIGVSDAGWLIVTGTDHVVRSFDGTNWREIARGYSAADW
jgi:WD40 repeat protein